MLQSIQQCLVNIRNTNTFMLMTINRCIDYTKVTKGLKLLPHLETVDVMDTIQVPLQCMRNIQSKMKITVLANAGKKPICSHVVTDRLWLQENLLCLLSNAVKYSNDGEVTIRLRLQKEDYLDDGDFDGEDSFSDNEDDDEEEYNGMIRRTRSNGTPRQSKLTITMSTSGSSKLGDHKGSNDSQDAEGNGNKINFTNDGRPNMASLVRTMSQTSAASHTGRPMSRRKKMLVVEVEDTGIGMTEEAMKILFNPFNQTQRLAGGTGLGLFSLAKRVEALQGMYGVRSRRDGRQGSLFWFAIPYRPDRFMAEVYANNDGPRFDVMRSTIAEEFYNSTVHEHNMSTIHSEALHSEGDANSVGARSARSLHQEMHFASGPELSGSAPGTDPTTPNASINRGTIPKLAIRIDEPAGGDISPPKPTRLPGMTAVPNENSRHILLVDDTPSILKMAGLMLKKLGHTISVAENGQIAVNMVRESLFCNSGGDAEHSGTHTRYDIIVMDLQMPVMDGLEAIGRIRSMEASSGKFAGGVKVTPHWIIGCSANSDLETQDAALAKGANMFMTKPYNVTTFCAAIAEAQLQ